MLSGLRKIWDEQIKTHEPLIGIVREVYQLLTKTNKLVKEKLWRVPPVDLAQSGEVFFMYTCLDYTLMTAHLLRSRCISGHFIINELTGPEWAKIHFGIETPYGFIDHVIGNSVIIGSAGLPNFYEPLKNEKQAARHRVDINQIRGEDTVFDIISRHKIRIMLLCESVVEQLAKKFEQDNTREVWENFIRRSGGDTKKPTIYLQE